MRDSAEPSTGCRSAHFVETLKVPVNEVPEMHYEGKIQLVVMLHAGG